MLGGTGNSRTTGRGKHRGAPAGSRGHSSVRSASSPPGFFAQPGAIWGISGRGRPHSYYAVTQHRPDPAVRDAAKESFVSDLLYEKKDHIATLKLNRPERMNAISLGMLAEFGRAIEDADDDEAVRVIVLTG